MRIKKGKPGQPTIVVSFWNPRIYDRDRGVMTPHIRELVTPAYWIFVPLFAILLALDGLTGLAQIWLILSLLPSMLISSWGGMWIGYRRWKRNNPILPDVASAGSQTEEPEGR